MEILEYYHHQYPNNNLFVHRKTSLDKLAKINLFGVRGSGKTSLALDYLDENTSEEILYIDIDDPNLLLTRLNSEVLQKYINRHAITLLVLDHYIEDYLHTFPNVNQIIVITRVALDDNTFHKTELFPLDYEEFLAFEGSSPAHRGFNHYLRSGTLPFMAKSQKTNVHNMKIFFQNKFNPNEQKLMLILSQHHTKHLSINQIYTLAKEHFKISKDWMYKTIKALQKEKVIFLLDDHYQKSGNKMLLFDFAFAKYLTTGQPFILQFDTMVALALIKHSVTIKTLGIHGYLTDDNELIIPAPFESEESLWTKSQQKFSLYKKYNIIKVSIITVANTYTYTIEKINFEALPFDEWSVSHNEE